MSPHRTIAELLGRPRMFYRSVALERDSTDPSAGRSFVLTPWLERGAREIVSGMCGHSTRRAWRLLGDFGVGKSALALALVQALDPRVADVSMPMRRLVKSIGNVPRMFPLLVTGSHDGLAQCLSASLARALGTPGLLGKRRREAIASIADPFDAIVEFRDALRETKRFDGLLVVIDEMGKFLEAAREDEQFDVFRLQALAEVAARSGDAPLAVLLILHKGFQSYAEDWRSARRSEWEKIAERFDEMVFDHPLSHTSALLAAALAADVHGVPLKVRKAHEDSLGRVRSLGWLGPRNQAGFTGCWPVHPSAVPIMARFFASYGQNERSLFGFAASEEPNGLRAFAAATAPNGGFYSIHHFFDYIASSYGHRLTSRTGAGEWSRIAAVLERAVDADMIETAVLKTVGILNLVDAPDLAASVDSVREALLPAVASSNVDTAISKLVAGGLLFRRPGRSELRLWTSRRVDLSTIWREAEEKVEGRPILRDLPRHLAALPIRSHSLARRHSVTTGTSRRFAIRCTHASELNGYTADGDNADGRIIAVFCGTAEDIRIAKAWSAEVTSDDPSMVVVVVPPMPDLGPLMVDLLRHRWVVSNASALQEDAYAAGEIERSIAELETRAVSSVESALGLRGRAPGTPIEGFWKGSPVRVDQPSHIIVSRLCDELYDQAPVVENELVNKHSLTSAGAAARQRLIERMFSNSNEAELGFVGGRNPPERALYLSLLKRGGIHREVDGDWIIGAPPPKQDPLRLAPALAAIESRLEEDGNRVALTEIYSILEARPFGIRPGLGPLLLAISLIVAGHRVALFERGTYCPKIDGAAFMRILKSPEHFALQLVALEGIRADVFRRLANLLKRPASESGIRAVVDPLIRFGVDLPFHTQHASAVTAHAQGVRRALAQARSPVDLLFNELPVACDLVPFGLDSPTDPERAGEFVRRLDSAVTELRGCYPGLLVSMREELFRTLEAPTRNVIADRAGALGFRAREQQLRTFSMRLADTGLPEDAWTEAIGGAVVGKPPARWLDNDVAAWRSKLSELCAHFQRVEATVFGATKSGRKAVRVSLTRSDGAERAVIVDLTDLTDSQRAIVGTIERMASDANLSVDKVVALLSLQRLENDEVDVGSQDSVERTRG